MNDTSDEVVRKIKSKITKARQDGEYETKVFSYLLTPRQKAVSFVRSRARRFLLLRI